MLVKRLFLTQISVMETKSLAFSKVYFLGIGGIGMSALARYFLSEGKMETTHKSASESKRGGCMS